MMKSSRWARTFSTRIWHCRLAAGPWKSFVHGFWRAQSTQMQCGKRFSKHETTMRSTSTISRSWCGPRRNLWAVQRQSKIIALHMQARQLVQMNWSLNLQGVRWIHHGMQLSSEGQYSQWTWNEFRYAMFDMLNGPADMFEDLSIVVWHRSVFEYVYESHRRHSHLTDLSKPYNSHIADLYIGNARKPSGNYYINYYFTLLPILYGYLMTIHW